MSKKRVYATVARRALTRLQHVPRIHLSFDMDAIDPNVAPGVGTPVPGGLHAGALRDAWRQLKDCAGLRAVEIVEYNPLRDRQGMTAQLICDLIGDLLSPESRADAQPGH